MRGITSIQNFMMDKRYFSLEQAREWLKKYGYLIYKVDITDKYYRFRFESPDHFKRGTMRTIELRPGVLSVIGVKEDRYLGEDIKRLNDMEFTVVMCYAIPMSRSLKYAEEHSVYIRHVKGFKKAIDLFCRNVETYTDKKHKKLSVGLYENESESLMIAKNGKK